MTSIHVNSYNIAAPARDIISDGFLARAQHVLEIALQPIVSIQTGSIYAYEALMRGYENMEFETIDDVLNAAHTFGVSDKLYLLLLDKSLEKLTSLVNSEDVKLFYNLDGRALEGDADLHLESMKLLEQYNFPPSSLCLEFSETYDYASALTVAEMVDAHRSEGINFAIDDFGRGFSELKVLYEYHPEFIKIDRFFIQEIVAEDRKRLFVETVVNLAHVLGIRVVAEGIETEAEFDHCRKLGCDLAQGYLIAKPQLRFPRGRFDCSELRQKLSLKKNRSYGPHSLVHQRIEFLEPLKIDANLSDIFEILRTSYRTSIVPILNDSYEPEGIIHEQDLKDFIYSSFGNDSPEYMQYSNSVREFIRPCSIADINSAADRILDIFAYQKTSDGIVITENGKYVGFLSAVSMLEIINDKRIETARDENPLSKLPGNASISRYWDAIRTAENEERCICYFDFDNFKPFNDSYSFLDGDKAITLFANILRKEFSGSKFMIGHVGGDDFFVGAIGISTNELMPKLNDIRNGFAKAAESLYSTEDRLNGYIEGRDRYGQSRQFPLLSCSAVSLEIPASIPVEDMDAVLQEISRLKRQAKQSDDGLATRTYTLRPSSDEGLSDQDPAEKIVSAADHRESRVA
ncbi:MAG: GGDEF domain-containing protein [Methyloligellaceae bacterium]